MSETIQKLTRGVSHRTEIRVISHVLLSCVVCERTGAQGTRTVEYRGRSTSWRSIQRDVHRYFWAAGTPLIGIAAMESVYADECGVEFPSRGG